MSDIINILAVAFIIVFWFFVIKRIIFSIVAPVKTVKAQVADKYITDVISKYPKTYRTQNYVVVFKTKTKKFLFVVSEYSYNNYRINEMGTLKYKGNKLISFD